MPRDTEAGNGQTDGSFSAAYVFLRVSIIKQLQCIIINDKELSLYESFKQYFYNYRTESDVMNMEEKAMKD
jgi:hypothetical protein